jgi:S1-C subfamily serine protease
MIGRRAAIATALAAAGGAWLRAGPARAQLPDTIERIKPSVVSVGTYQPIRRPPSRFLGTGFAVAGGDLIVTCAHVIPTPLDSANNETLAVFTGVNQGALPRQVELIERDDDYDVALLRILSGERFPPLNLSAQREPREGRDIAVTGFPIPGALGLYPVTHRGIVAAITPFARPAASNQQLDANIVRRLRNNFAVLQLDITAYPGNSGSPVYDAATGDVLGVVNSVLVRGGRERALSAPSGITYAVPIQHLRPFLTRHKVIP